MSGPDFPGMTQVLQALCRPATLADISDESGRSIAEAARILLYLLRDGRAVAYCGDHFILRDTLVDHADGSIVPGWSVERRIMAVLGQSGARLAELSEQLGLPEEQVLPELFALRRLGAVSSSAGGRTRLWWRCGGLAGRLQRKRRVEHMAVQAVVLSMLGTPHSSGQVAKAIGYSAGVMNDLVQDLLHSGRLTRVDQSRYVRSATPWPTAAGIPTVYGWVDGRRPQPVRDAILADLTEPRQAVEIARAVERTVPNVTGHLRAMLRLGLVERVGYGRYARPGTPGLPPVEQRSFCRPGTATHA